MRRRSLLATLTIPLALACAGGVSGCGLGDAADTGLGGPGTPASGQTGPGGAADDDLVDTTPSVHCIPPACEEGPLPPSTHVTRLTRSQWERTMKDLLRLPAEPGNSVEFPVDPSVSADHFGTEAGDVVVTTTHAKAFEKAAEALAALVVDDPVALDRLLPAAAKSGDTGPRIQAFLADFLPRAYRRPVTPLEIAEMVAVGEKVVLSDTTSDPFLLRAKWILSTILQSPKVLYRIELGEGPVKNGRARLGPYEIASKLSYAVWNTMPDAALFAAAASGKLSTKAGVAEVANAMLASAQAETTIETFHEQLLFTWDFVTAHRKTEVFPRYWDGFTSDIQEDVRRTIKDVVIDKNGGVKDLYTSTTAYVTTKLAPVYDIDPASVPELVANPNGWARVQMDPKKRIGILMHPGWLAYEGGPKDPSIIRRGAYMARHLLCLPLGRPPPAAVGASPDKSAQPTNRLRVAETTKGCGDGCHGGPNGIINPLGFGLESFDSLGAFRTKDGELPVDATGSAPEVGNFDGGVQLLTAAAKSPSTHACYAAHWIAFLNGTTKIDATPRWLTPIVDRSLKGAPVREILGTLVQSDAFLTVSR